MFVIEIKIDKPQRISERTHRQLMRKALEAAIVEQLLHRLKKHFEGVPENRPGGEYGYVAPTKRHMLHKARKYGHQTPNVFSGRERLFVLANARVSANYHKATLTIRSYHPKRDEQGKNWRDTVAAIADSERPAITATMHKVYRQGYDAHMATRQRVSFN